MIIPVCRKLLLWNEVPPYGEAGGPIPTLLGVVEDQEMLEKRAHRRSAATATPRSGALLGAFRL